MEINIKKRIDKDGVSPSQGHPIPRSEDREISPDLADKTWPQNRSFSSIFTASHYLTCSYLLPLINFLSQVMNDGVFYLSS